MAESNWAAIEQALERLEVAAKECRESHVPGTPEKYPRTDVRVLLLDLEELLAAVGEAKRRESEREEEAEAFEDNLLAFTEKAEVAVARVAELKRALARAIEALDHYTVSSEDAAAMRRWVGGAPTLERELKTANFFRDKLAERLTLVETAVVELEGALGCDESVDPAHWREHAKHAMESALGLCKRATRVREATGE